MVRETKNTIGDQIAEGPQRKYTINFFGWCHEPDSKKKHDKIWGWVTFHAGTDRMIYNFWGSRTGRLTFKRHANASWGERELEAMTKRRMRPRENGQYQEVEVDRIETVSPNFYERFEKQMTLAKLFDKIRGEGDFGKE